MRAIPRLLCAAATITTFCSASCGSTSPARASATGHWIASTVVATEQWNFDLSMTEQGDSLRGSATVVSVPPRVSNAYMVTGTVSGDSVQLLLRPIEDADIHIVASVTATRLTGRMWLNQFTDAARAISFERQSAQ